MSPQLLKIFTWDFTHNCRSLAKTHISSVYFYWIIPLFEYRKYLLKVLRAFYLQLRKVFTWNSTRVYGVIIVRSLVTWFSPYWTYKNLFQVLPTSSYRVCVLLDRLSMTLVFLSSSENSPYDSSFLPLFSCKEYFWRTNHGKQFWWKKVVC